MAWRFLISTHVLGTCAVRAGWGGGVRDKDGAGWIRRALGIPCRAEEGLLGIEVCVSGWGVVGVGVGVGFGFGAQRRDGEARLARG